MGLNPNLIYLAQTDTTIGFLSQDIDRLKRAKERIEGKSFIKVIASFKHLTLRVPILYKNLVRRSKKTTFIYPNGSSFRVIKDSKHAFFVKKFDWIYSSSANKSGEGFDMEFAKNRADVLVLDSRGYFEAKPSKLIKLSRKSLKKLR